MDKKAPLGMLEIATPAWAEGYSYRLHGLERQDNPYLNAADGREAQWDDGWLYADAALARGQAPAHIFKHGLKKGPREPGPKV
jgi:hypothetical protein